MSVVKVITGINTTPVSTAATSLLYTGEHFDASAQQYYLRARYYDPLNGRFNRIDPFAGNNKDPQSLHKYLYCHANPINRIDPTGMMSFGEVVCTIGIIATLVGAILVGYGIIKGDDRTADIGWNVVLFGLILAGSGAAWIFKAVKGAHSLMVALTVILVGIATMKATHGIHDYISEDDWEAKMNLRSLVLSSGSEGQIPSHGILLIREGVTHLNWATPNWKQLSVQYSNGDKIFEYWIESEDSRTVKVRQAIVTDASVYPPVCDEILAPTEIGTKWVSGALIYEANEWALIETSKESLSP